VKQIEVEVRVTISNQCEEGATECTGHPGVSMVGEQGYKGVPEGDVIEAVGSATAIAAAQATAYVLRGAPWVIDPNGTPPKDWERETDPAAPSVAELESLLGSGATDPKSFAELAERLAATGVAVIPVGTVPELAELERLTKAAAERNDAQDPEGS
jgi:hypothetical protein